MIVRFAMAIDASDFAIDVLRDQLLLLKIVVAHEASTVLGDGRRHGRIPLGLLFGFLQQQRRVGIDRQRRERAR